MRVPFSYLERQFASSSIPGSPGYTDAMLEDIRAFVQTGDFTLGAKLEEFEERFAETLGVAHAVGVNSGTDALILSLRALSVGHGDEVITSAETFIATAGAIVAVGARPVFVDVRDDFLLDPEQVARAITVRTKAIIPVWFTGAAPAMDALIAIARAHELPIVEDSCCAIGASFHGQRAGSFGVTGTFSLHPLKNVNVWGDAGMITTQDRVLARQLRLLRNHGLVSRDEVACFGVNSRLDTLQALLGLRMLADVEDITARRIACALRLDAAFRDIPQLTVPPRDPHARAVFHLYMVRAEDRDALLAHCNACGVEAKVHYPIPLPYQACARSLGYHRGDFPKTERDCDSIITFPCHQHLSDGEIDTMIDVVRSFYLGGTASRRVAGRTRSLHEAHVAVQQS